MVRSEVLTFVDPLAYQAAVRAGPIEVLVTSKGEFHAELMKVDLDRLWLQRASERLPRIQRAFTDTKVRAPILFLPRANQAMQYAGRDISGGDLIVYGRNAAHHSRTEAASGWASVSLTPDDLAVAGKAIAGRELTLALDTHILSPAPELMRRLRMLHDEVERLAKTAPHTLARPQVAKALEQDLIHTMIGCLTGHQTTGSASLAGHHARVIARFEEYLAARRYQPVYLAEICAAIGISERTLRTCCHEQLGMGPIHYLWLRRMHLARRALLRSDGQATTVTEVATEHGFWELGRFSVEYRSLFGETPSASLRRATGETAAR